jgi:hypothetical protein
MTSPKDASELSRIAQMMYRNEQQKLARLQSEEARVRKNLAILDAQIRTSRSELQRNSDLKCLGGDIVWQAWCDRARKQILTELAGILARKEPLKKGLAQSFGRKTALEELQGKVKRDTRKRREAASLRRINGS